MSTGVATSHAPKGMGAVETKKHVPHQPQGKAAEDDCADDDGVCDDEQGFYSERLGEVLQDRYEIGELLGQGSFGKVVKAFDMNKQEHVVIKIIRNRKAFFNQAQQEIALLKHLCSCDLHDRYNIVRLLDDFIFKGHQCLVFEPLSYSLYDLLRNNNFKGVSLNLVRRFSHQILASLLFLSKQEVNIIHCDLKPENVLLRHPRRSAVKLIDFGSSCREPDQPYTYIQSRFYRAPEVILRFPRYTKAIDMWSLACLMVEMHTGEPLFDGTDEPKQIHRIVSLLGVPSDDIIMRGRSGIKYFCVDPLASGGQRRWMLKPDASLVQPPRDLSDILGVETCGPGGRWQGASGHAPSDYVLFKDLLLKMLVYDPAARITPADAIAHPFFSKPSRSLDRPLSSKTSYPALTLYQEPSHGSISEIIRAAPSQSQSQVTDGDKSCLDTHRILLPVGA